MTAPLPTDDPNGIFPTLDDIPPPTPPDVPVGFDLVQLLSDSMRARPQWRDYAAMSSRILHAYVESVRLALQNARDPSVLARTLKIATLRLCGLDWNTDLLTDDDYDRVLDAIAEFMQTNGPQYFAEFIGYALGVPMEWIPLWTQDYVAFAPGPPLTLDGVFNGRVDDNPPGLAYPTNKGDLTIDPYAARAPRLDTDAARSDIEDVFYKIAPIHLVLESIAKQIALSVGNLYMQLGFREESEQNVIVDRHDRIPLYLIPGFRETCEASLVLQPAAPSRRVPVGRAVLGIDAGGETAHVHARGVWFCPGYAISAAGVSVENSPGGWLPSLHAGGPTASLQPDSSYVDPLGARGLPVTSATEFYINAPTDPRALASSGCSVSSGPALPDGTPGWTVSCAAPNGTLSVAPPATTRFAQCVQWSFRVHDSAHRRIARGTQWVDLVVSGGVPTVTADPATSQYGAFSLSGNAWCLWGVFTVNGVVTVTPGYDTPSTVDWIALEVEDRTRPSLVGALDGIAAPFSRSGTVLTVDPDVLSYACGVLAIRAQHRWPGDASSSPLVDFQSLLGDHVTLSLTGTAVQLVTSRGDSLATGAVAGGDVTAALRWAPELTILRCGSLQASTPRNLVQSNYARATVLSSTSDAPRTDWTLRTLLLMGASDASQLPSDATVQNLLTQAGL